MITLAELIILVLACWRLVNFIVDDGESGPFELFDKIRYLLGWRSQPDGRPLIVAEDGPFQKTRLMIGEASQCMWCLSVWVGGILAIGFWIIPEVIILLSLPFALSAGAIVVKEKIK